MTPDFAEFLLATPAEQRQGPVFAPYGKALRECRLADCASKVISKFGKAAGVKVNTSASGKVKFASAHDFRRSLASVGPCVSCP